MTCQLRPPLGVCLNNFGKEGRLLCARAFSVWLLKWGTGRLLYSIIIVCDTHRCDIPGYIYVTGAFHSRQIVSPSKLDL